MVPFPPLRPLVVDVPEDDWATAARAWWPFGRTGPSLPTSGTPFAVTVALADGGLPPSVVRQHSTPGAWDSRHVTVSRDEFWVYPSDGRSGVLVRASTNRAEVVVHSVEGPDEFLGHCLVMAFVEAVCLSGLVLLHAACAARDSRVVAFVGPSGRGKSTTLLHAVGAGWTAISEDSCWLDPHTGLVVGGDQTVGVRADMAGAVGALLPDAALPARAGAKHLLSWSQLPNTASEPSLLTEICELHRDATTRDRPSRLSSNSRLRAAMALYESTGIPHLPAQRERLAAVVGELVETLDLTRLTIGRRPLPFS